MRHEGGLVLATLIRMTGDFDIAEDAVQDAVLAALEAWPRTGVPASPGAWLTTVARRKALDRIRREANRGVKEKQAASLLADDAGASASVGGAGSMVADDVLRLIFTCCHPALSFEAQVALTLRAVCGLSTDDIAAVFLVPSTTMGQRITRAKRKIAAARIPYRVPADYELFDRLRPVLKVVYSVFTSGHAVPGRVDVAAESIRLARLLVALVRDEPEATGLLALLLSTQARAGARVDDAGRLVLLADQDRSRWDHELIAEAAALVDAALRRRRPGTYQVQAAISCLHGLAPRWEATDWKQIVELYELLSAFEPTPVVAVNRAVAIGELHGPAQGLDALADVEGLEEWHLYWATKADFLRRLGRMDSAAAAYSRALACGPGPADEEFLRSRLASVRGN